MPLGICPTSSEGNKTTNRLIQQSLCLCSLKPDVCPSIRIGQVDYLWYNNKSDQQSVTETINSIVSTSTRTDAPTPFIHKQRLIKSESEIKLMRRTCQIAAESINKTMQKSRPGAHQMILGCYNIMKLDSFKVILSIKFSPELTTIVVWMAQAV